MYVHVGGDVTIPADKIIGIFDIENVYGTKEFNKNLKFLLKYVNEPFNDKRIISVFSGFMLPSSCGSHPLRCHFYYNHDSANS